MRKTVFVQNHYGIGMIRLYTAYKVVIYMLSQILGIFGFLEHHHVPHTWLNMSITKFYRLFGFKSLNMSDFTFI